jgi:hypothetical protein
MAREPVSDDYQLKGAEWLKLTAEDLMGATPIAPMFGVRELVGHWDVRVVQRIGAKSQMTTPWSDALFWQCRCFVRFRRMMTTSFKVQYPNAIGSAGAGKAVTVITQNRWAKKRDPAEDATSYYHFLSFDAALFYALRTVEPRHVRTYELWCPSGPGHGAERYASLRAAFASAVDTARTLVALSDDKSCTEE